MIHLFISKKMGLFLLAMGTLSAMPSHPLTRPLLAKKDEAVLKKSESQHNKKCTFLSKFECFMGFFSLFSLFSICFSFPKEPIKAQVEGPMAHDSIEKNNTPLPYHRTLSLFHDMHAIDIGLFNQTIPYTDLPHIYKEKAQWGTVSPLYLRFKNVLVTNNHSCGKNRTRTVIFTLCIEQKTSRGDCVNRSQAIFQKIFNNKIRYAHRNAYDFYLMLRPIHPYKGAFTIVKQRIAGLYHLMYNPRFESNQARCRGENTTYDRVLYMDLDTAIANHNHTIDDLLSTDIRPYYDTHRRPIDEISMIAAGDALAHLNAGVLLFLKNNTTQLFLKKWENLATLYPEKHDQDTLMLAMVSNLYDQNVIDKQYWSKHEKKIGGLWKQSITEKQTLEIKNSNVIDPTLQDHMVLIKPSLMNSNMYIVCNSKRIKDRYWIAHFGSHVGKVEFAADMAAYADGKMSEQAFQEAAQKICTAHHYWNNQWINAEEDLVKKGK